MLWIFTLSCCMAVASAATRTTAPSGCIIVGSGGVYSGIQKALDSLSTTSTSAQCLFIKPGTYLEQVYIAPRHANLTIYGYTEESTHYYNNTVTITYNLSLLSGAASDDATGTVRNHAANTKFYNINIKNTYGSGSQAIALSAYGNQQSYYGVGLYGYQDTLLSETGTQVYARCYIEGAIDFIFGQHARTWIDSSDIRIASGGLTITASGRPSSSDPSYYVLHRSSIAAAPSAAVSVRSVYLGRPWAEYARVCVQETVMSNIINSAGWSVWEASDSNTAHVVFQEFGNAGAGASGARASFATKLNAALSVETILGSAYASWVDTSYLA